MRRTSLLLALFTLLTLAALSISFATGGALAQDADPTETPIPGEREEARLVHVTDGDTIVVELDDGLEYRVRFIGIDTPETHHPDVGADYWGYEATEFVRQFLKEGDTVILEKDITDRDIYNRLLRYIFVEDEDGNEVFINAELVREGFAHVRTYEPDVKYTQYFYALEREAQNARRRIWGPRPTKPAQEALVEDRDHVWVAGEPGELVSLLYDADQGEPVMWFPAGVEVMIEDVFWMDSSQSFWYWLELKDFRGWVEADAFVTEEPDEVFPGPESRLIGYDEAYIIGDAPLEVYELPTSDDADEPLGTLEADTRPQVKRITYNFDTESWWYYVDTQTLDGWVDGVRLSKSDPDKD